MVEAGGEGAAELRIELLGGFAVWVGDRLIQGAYSKWRSALLLQLLALQESMRIERRVVVATLWPEGDGDTNFHQALRELRLLLEPGLARARDSAYLPMSGSRLLLHPNGRPVVDAQAFRAALRHARETRQAADYDAALDLYTGLLLPRQAEPWVRGHRARLREELHAGLREAMAAHDGAHDVGGALKHAQRLARELPKSVQARADLVRLLARTGHGQDALREYDALRQLAHRSEVQIERDIHDLVGELLEGSGDQDGAHTAEVVSGRGKSGVASAKAPTTAERSTRTNIVDRGASFVGRDRELEDVRERLARSRLVTLTGPGGSGKTRLARRAALERLRESGELAYEVRLASVGDAEQMPPAVEAALGLPEGDPTRLPERIDAWLAGSRLLLVVDNCEHLREACAALARDLLDGCPGVRVLATSREPLGLGDELVYHVAAMGLPAVQGDAEANAEAVRRSDAGTLFVERAKERSRGFTLSDANASAVAEICRRLDGLPLALELAAAQVGFLSLGDIARRLGDLFAVLGSDQDAEPRHQTLERALDWSHERLSAGEVALFRRLAVFADGWTLEAAELVCSGPDTARRDVVGLLRRLVERSLVEVDDDDLGGTRYRLLEPVRQYAQRRLEDAGERERLRRRHAVWCARLARRADTRLMGPELRAVLATLRREGDNLRAALRWAVERSSEVVGIRLGAALARYWALQGLFGEGRDWLGRLIAAGGPQPSRRVSPAYARVLTGYSWLATLQGDFARALPLAARAIRIWRTTGDTQAGLWGLNILSSIAEEVGKVRQSERLNIRMLQLAREAGDRRRFVTTLSNLGDLALREGRYEDAWAWFDQCLTEAIRAEDESAIAIALANLGRTELRLGRPERGIVLLRRALEKGRALQDPRATGDTLIRLGHAYGMLGHWAEAAEAFAEALRLHHRSGHVTNLLVCFEGFGTIAYRMGMLDVTVRLAAFTAARRAASGMAPPAADARERERTLRALRKRMGAKAYDAEETIGRTLTADEAAALTEQIARAAKSRER